jgi:hypothetical protein
MFRRGRLMLHAPGVAQGNDRTAEHFPPEVPLERPFDALHPERFLVATQLFRGVFDAATGAPLQRAMRLQERIRSRKVYSP